MAGHIPFELRRIMAWEYGVVETRTDWCFTA